MIAGATHTKVSVTSNNERLWSDGLSARAVAVCGNLRFAAVALQGGLLQVRPSPGIQHSPSNQLARDVQYVFVNVR